VVDEPNLYLGTPRTASVCAETPCLVHRLRRESLERMERDEPELAVALPRSFARLIAGRLSETLDTLQNVMD